MKEIKLTGLDSPTPKKFVTLGRNVSNLDEFPKFSAEYKHEDPKIFTWINSNFRRWLINYGPTMVLTELPDKSPEWMRKAFAADQEVFVILYDVALRTLRPVIDYFRHIVATGHSIDRVSVSQAIEKQKSWHEELKKTGGVSDIDEDHIERVLTHTDGYFWVRVLGKDSLTREGDIMGHCVGGYYNSVAAGRTIIYSLRDPKNQPHLTLEANNQGCLLQAKCKGNDPVPKRYLPKFLEFICEVNIKSFDSECTEYDLEYIETNEIVKYYKQKGKYIAPKEVETSFGEFKRVQVLSEDSVPRVSQSIEKLYKGSDLIAECEEAGNTYDVTFNWGELKNNATVENPNLIDMLTKIWLTHAKSNARHFKIRKLSVLDGSENRESATNAAILSKKAKERAGSVLKEESLKFSNGKYDLVIIRETAKSEIFCEANGLVGTSSNLLRKQYTGLQPNLFIMSKKGKIELSGSVSYKNLYILSGTMKAGFSDLLGKISSGKTIISGKASEVVNNSNELDIDPNFTYKNASAEVKTILHRGIYPSQKFEKLMQQLYNVTTMDDFISVLLRNRLAGRPKYKKCSLKQFKAYEKDSNYVTRHQNSSWSRNYYYYAEIGSSVFRINKPSDNIKAFAAALFCSPRTRKFLIQLMHSNSQFGKAMMYILKLIPTSIKMANALLYGYDASHLRKNLLAAAKLLRNVDKFFDMEQIKDPKVLALFEMIKVKRDEQQHKSEEQVEANTA